MAFNLSFSKPEPLLFLSSSSTFILTTAEWTPFQTHSYSEHLAAPGIELGSSGSAARKSNHQTIEVVLLTDMKM
jgi:hypothetical protein